MDSYWRKKLKETVKELLVYEPEKIILYGSAVRGELTDESDVDLLIIKKTDKGMFDRIGEVLTLWKTRTIPIEPIVLTPEEFEKMCSENRLYAENILKEGEILYERK